jgi:DNA-binding MarR family transcriptional regulator
MQAAAEVRSGDNAVMTDRKTAKDLTPAGRLAEARLHEVIGYQIAQASIATLGVFHRAAGASLELRAVEFTILVLIKENPGGTAARLARALAVSAPNITMWLDKLERRGLVRREASETDRRTQHLHVTDKGRRIADEAMQRLIEAERDAFSHLTAGERAILVELLHKLALKRSE